VLFPYIQPERFDFEYDLTFEDHRLASFVIFQLVEKEGEGNLKDPVFTANGGEEDEANFWLSQK